MIRSTLVETGDPVTLIAASTALLDLEDAGGPVLAAGLGVAAPASWPPQHNDPETRAWIRRMVIDNPDEPTFGSWYAIAQQRLVGICGFKGPPDLWGEVVIGYSIVDAEHRRGYGLAAAGLLVAMAFRDPRVKVIVAETLPALAASQRILIRCGFSHVGGYRDEEIGQVMRFELNRPVKA